MGRESLPMFTLQFGHNHVHTAGKVVNTTEALEQMEAGEVFLSVTNGAWDGAESLGELRERLVSTVRAIRTLRRQGVRTHLVLPSLSGLVQEDGGLKRQLRRLYAEAAGESRAVSIWIDDTYEVGGGGRGAGKTGGPAVGRREYVGWFRTMGRTIRGVSARLPVGLIAAEPGYYGRLGLSGPELAEVLAGGGRAMLAQAQPLGNDYCRTDILGVAQVLGTVSALARKGEVSLVGQLRQGSASTFQKSTESVQMQMNLNVLFGFENMVLDCFGAAGTAAGEGNPYVQTCMTTRGFYKRLSRFGAGDYEASGICCVLPEPRGLKGASAGAAALLGAEGNPWPVVLWRLGLPVTFATAGQVADCEGPFVLAGAAARLLSRAQLKHVFEQGVLLDVEAAKSLAARGLGDLTGVKVGRKVKGAQTEIFSDPGCAWPYFAKWNELGGADGVGSVDVWELEPNRAGARLISSLGRRDGPPTMGGMAVYESEQGASRCAVLPYSIGGQEGEFLLTQARQRHFQDVFHFLRRRRLDCMVESTADLAPFFVVDKARRRAGLALLNVGFDWVLEGRIRLGSLGFAAKRVLSLNEQGRWVEGPALERRRDYQYIQLDSDSAVPPMQMTMLRLEG